MKISDGKGIFDARLTGLAYGHEKAVLDLPRCCLVIRSDAPSRLSD